MRFFAMNIARLTAALVITVTTSLSLAATALPAAAVDMPAAAKPGTATAVVAGGCFWGLEAVFEHVKGVTRVTSGYAGGDAGSAHYDKVSMGTTGHAESVRIAYDPSKVSYGQLLRVFFAVAHNPTELNRQGPDTGTQYRSAIFYANDEQKRVAQAYIAQLNAAKAFSRPIVTAVVPLKAFYDAETYHQDYAARNPEQPYIVINDAPKVASLQRQLPDLYVPGRAR